MSNNVMSNLLPVVVATAVSPIDAPNAVVLPPPVVMSTTAPISTGYIWENTSTTPSTFLAYDVNLATWVPFTGANGADGAPGQVFSMLSAAFTAGAPNATGLLCDVTNRNWLQVGGFTIVVDSTGTWAIYNIMSWSSSPSHPNGILMTRVDPGTGTNTASNGYSFNTTNGSMAQITGAYQTTSSVAGALTFLGPWNAATNTPTLVSSVGTTNTYYVVSIGGSTTLNGHSSWAEGDWFVFVSGAWTWLGNFGVPISSSLPNALTVGGSGSAGTTGQASDAGHIHAMPGIFNTALPGFVAAAGLSKPYSRVLKDDGTFGAVPLTYQFKPF